MNKTIDLGRQQPIERIGEAPDRTVMFGLSAPPTAIDRRHRLLDTVDVDFRPYWQRVSEPFSCGRDPLCRHEPP
ncbi:hypothetical protein QTQ03_23025 [Micromonospora sp. WMMA1363]|uniref:hypothetical protein n=1 Tax=Micromonospora sp. WMMA1363 TaxID=3053985 RepID=UPI00259CEF94|nr:hypothetical protein [Micromonospora sp. WMMA1363]MDM4722317.1 hypothetical protein [Micromonospora sp. WMMA1363]